MKIIDAHLHIFPSEPGTDAMARGVGHENSVEHLRQVYGELEIVHGVVMGNRSLEPDYHCYPAPMRWRPASTTTPGTCSTTAWGWTAWCSAGGATSRRTCPTRWRSI